MATPFVWRADTVATGASVLPGLAPVALSLRRGPIRERYGDWNRRIVWRWLVRRRHADCLHQRHERPRRHRLRIKLAGYGINDEFMRSLGSTIAPGTSALFVLVRKVDLAQVLPELLAFGGTLWHTPLSHEQEARLRAALNDLNRPAVAA
jgi:hypothetical protein